MAVHPIYQFYAELDDYRPSIWRRFQVTDNITVARLGYIIQVLFEMKASHLMAMEVPSGKMLSRYEIPCEGVESFFNSLHDVRVLDATQTPLRHAIYQAGEILNLNYDFGDDWWVSLKLETVFEDKTLPGRELPRVLEGAGFGIVENVGGVGGLEDFVTAFQKKKGADYMQYSEWLGISDFDMSAFDLDDLNFRLKKIPRIYKQSYEDRLYPTQQSIDLIERKYLHKKP